MSRKMGHIERVIDKKIYNTETSNELFYVSNKEKEKYRTNQFEEALYKTDKGNYFMAGRGGPCTRWRQIDERIDRIDFIEGEGIIPISEYLAIAWLTKHNAPVRIFNMIIDDLTHA